MRTLSLSPLARLAGLAPLSVQIIAGIIIFAHGLQKLQGGPSGFGQALAGIGIPAPELMAYVVTFVELVGGARLIVGLYVTTLCPLAHHRPRRRDPASAGKLRVALPPDGGAGAELDLALIAGLLVILLAG